jgi:fructuronate reductase
MMIRLSQRALADLPHSVRRPDVDRAALRTGIVHLVLGAFARAHLAAFTQPLLAADPSWGILGVSLRSPATRAALAPQDFLYTRAARDGGGISLSVMSVLTGILVAPEDPAAVVTAMAAPDVRIVSISVSERGYHRRAADGTLDETDPLIRADLSEPEAPHTVPGLIAAALRLRRDNGVLPFSVLCCDNLPDNGNSTRSLVGRFARLCDPSLADFIANDVAFPNTMVDQIVPATTAADRAEIDAALGMHDAWPVVCEPFRQWVIEDRFPLGRPTWEHTGSELVTDVRPYEAMKLRMLNGSHSAIAYLGQLAGWPSVSDAIADRSLAAFIKGLMGEAAATVVTAQQVDPAAYGRALMARFANPALKHQTAQIARDGSQKLPMRLFATALPRGAQGLASPHVALAVAAWLRFLQGRADDGTPLTIVDPKKDALLAAARGAATSRLLCDAIFAFHDVVPPSLADDTAFCGEVTAALEDLATLGVRGALIKSRRREDYREQTESTDRGPGPGRVDGVTGAGARHTGTG